MESDADTFDFCKDLSEKGTNALLLDNIYGHLATILYRTDRMGMMASIENRVPFLENNIIDYALNLPVKFKIKGNMLKRVLKLVAEKYLPHEIIYRPKAGFPVPWARYIQFNPDLFENGFITKHLNLPLETIRRVTNSDQSLLFRFYAIEIWGRIFVNQENRDQIRELVCRD